MTSLRVATLCALIFACSGYLIAGKRTAFERFDARVMPWVEPGWRMPRPRRMPAFVQGPVKLSSDEVLAAGIGGLLSVLLVAVASPHRLVVSVPAAAIGAATGIGMLQQARRRGKERRDRRIGDEVPQIADLLALHISAGLSISDGLRAVAQMTDGLLSLELRFICAQIDDGVPLGSALRASRNRSTATLWSSLADALIGCVERGAPVAATIRAQAHDARTSRHQQLMADAGKREVAMLAPVVFLTLPVTVVVALLPGVAAFKAGI